MIEHTGYLESVFCQKFLIVPPSYGHIDISVAVDAMEIPSVSKQINLFSRSIDVRDLMMELDRLSTDLASPKIDARYWLMSNGIELCRAIT